MKKPEFTLEQIEEYVDNPEYCPVCASKDIRTIDTDWNTADAWRTVKCSDCQHSWVECFKLFTIDNLEKDNE